MPERLFSGDKTLLVRIVVPFDYFSVAYGHMGLDWPWLSPGDAKIIYKDPFETIIEKYPDDVKWILYSRLKENKDVINIFWLKNSTWGTAEGIVVRMDPFRESTTKTRFASSMGGKPQIKVFENPIQLDGGEIVRTGETPVYIRFPFLSKGEKVMLIFQSLGRGLSDDFLDVAFQREFFPSPRWLIVIFVAILIVGVILCCLENRNGLPVTLPGSS